MSEIPTFYLGDTIRVELRLHDKSGVSRVVGVFTHTSPGVFGYGDPALEYADIRLEGSGKGQTKANVVIMGKVSDETASGEYVCRYIQAYDAQGNYRTFHPQPNISFRVENRKDREGPELSEWRFAEDPANDETGQSWWRRLLRR